MTAGPRPRQGTYTASAPDRGEVATLYRAVGAMIAAGGAQALLSGRAHYLDRSERRRLMAVGGAAVAAGLVAAGSRRAGGLAAGLLRPRPVVTAVGGLVPTMMMPW